MKCPKCNYTSFDYLETCKRCGIDLRDARSLLQIIAVSPEDQAPAAPAAERVEEALLDEAAVPEAESFGDMQPLGDDEEILEEMDFEGSFDEMMEPTSYADQASFVEPTSYAEKETAVTREPVSDDEEEDELLDLDFGDLFEEKEP